MKSLVIALLMTTLSSVSSFLTKTRHQKANMITSCYMRRRQYEESPSDMSWINPSKTRRSFMASMAGLGTSTASLILGGGVLPANAIPMITTDEFGIILRDSPRSIEVVEFSGPKSETVTVRLVDGTAFGIKDIVESSTDPRSPLKVSAQCRENGVKTKFVDLESMLSRAPKKKKLYTNQRVQDAQEKEREKQERLRRDEEERLAALRRMEEEERLKEVAATAGGGD